MPTPDFSTDKLVQALSQTIPCLAVEAALDQTVKRQRRSRKLPSALGLLVNLSRRQGAGHPAPAHPASAPTRQGRHPIKPVELPV